ncbi:hypothetical protein D3C86_1983220 [compost metagenome]
MQVQFGLGQTGDEGVEFAHGEGLLGHCVQKLIEGLAWAWDALAQRLGGQAEFVMVEPFLNQRPRAVVDG